MILIADSGATKTDWCLINGQTIENFQTEGYHPFFVNATYISDSLKKNLPASITRYCDQIKQVYFYSTGVGYSVEADAILKEGVTSVFNKALISLETDLLGAARSLLQKETGLAVILGTGSNSGLYDGSRIAKSVESGGFLLGDEGSGSYLGKLIISSFIRDLMPNAIKKDFEQKYKLTPAQIINEVYTSSQPNQYCAQYAAFVGRHIENSFCRDLALKNFSAFFQNIISCYEHHQNYTIHAVGSVAYHLKEIFVIVANTFNMKVGKVLPFVIDGLMEYHRG